jgi:hypothetical protein
MPLSIVRAGTGLMKHGIGPVIDAGLEFYNRRENHPEESILKSAGFAALNYAAWTVMPAVMWAKTFGDIARSVAPAIVNMGIRQATIENMRFNNGGYLGNGFQDTQQKATARRRGLAAMEQSRLNIRSALGNEARSLHR